MRLTLFYGADGVRFRKLHCNRNKIFIQIMVVYRQLIKCRKNGHDLVLMFANIDLNEIGITLSLRCYIKELY